MRPLLLFILILSSFSSPSLAVDFVNPKANIPPLATPERRNAGEGVPPLPLPATPLRRSEKKREPSPPKLIGSITFSQNALKSSGVNWQTTVIDIEKIIDFSNRTLGQRFGYQNTEFGKFSYDPTELPILYFTGWQPLPDFDDATIVKMRQYLTDGGTWIVHSNCGRPEFNQSFEKQIRRMFPDRDMVILPGDHPIFSSFSNITTMHVRKSSDPWLEVPPLLKAINIGTRAAVIFSPIDLSCGWDANAHPIEGGILYNQQDAQNLAGNIVTYALAEYQYGRFFAHAKIYHQETDKTRDQLVLGQIVHNGDWDATPHGLPNLLKMIDTSTTLHVQFKRVAVDPEKMDLYNFPVLYMSGQEDFAFSDTARKKLRQYFDHGGTLLVDNVIGASDFETAFLREIKLIYPDKALTDLPADSPLLNYVFDERKAALAPLARQLYGDAITPQLKVIDVDGQYPVIFSPLSLSAGWEQLPRAYDKGYADDDALKLGANILMYVVSH